MSVNVTSCETHVQIGIARPPVNAFSESMLRDFIEALTRLHDDPRPIALAGDGKIFSAGFDTKDPGTPETANMLAQQCIWSVRNHPTPVVAAVEGAAVGLGLLLATSADVLVISRTALARMPEVTIGLTADPEALRRFLPDPWIRRLCLLGTPHTAEDLSLDRTGAILCEPGTAREVARSLLDSMSGNSPESLGQMKSALTVPTTRQ
ncbi:enoyl-CoA hydratase [Rhodococcus sp. 27YEA15]|uniref:enoyl-CoA hydratase-related protein n=1 Tax=Rhodococcus sp. 27YEA15 TaxID=3156259 RepID=UPI003C7AE0BF